MTQTTALHVAYRYGSILQDNRNWPLQFGRKRGSAVHDSNCSGGPKELQHVLLEEKSKRKPFSNLTPAGLSVFVITATGGHLSAIYLKITYDMQALSLQTYIVIHVQYVKL